MTPLSVRKVLEDRRLLWAVTFVAAVSAYLGPIASYDLWWHLKAGGLILQTGAVPHADPFSFTAAGRPWIYHSWLSGVALTLVWRAGGAAGIVLFRAVMMAAGLMAAWLAARRRGVGPGLASVLVLAACLQMKMRALARPYLFSFVLFVLFVLILQAAASSPDPPGREVGRRRPETPFLWGRGGRLLLLPVLMLLWVNLHAGFIAGLLVIGAYGVGEMVGLALRRDRPAYAAALLKGPSGARFRAMFASGALCLAACLATPNGAGSLVYPFRLMLDVKLVKRIQEWQPVPVSGQFAVFWAVLVLGALVMARSARLSARAGRLRAEAGQFVTDALLMGGFAGLAVQAVRHMAWLLLLAPCVVGWHLRAGARADPEDGTSGPGDRPLYAYVALLLAFVVSVCPFVVSGVPRFEPAPHLFPVKACDFIASRALYRRPYNSYEWGGYLIWRAWPEMKVFIDGRCLVYGDGIIGQALQVQGGEGGWEEVLSDRDVELLLVRYRKRDTGHLFRSGRWRCVYWDDVAVVALRDDVLDARRDELAQFPLSNPALFHDRLEDIDPEAILAELDAVLARDPDCWTARAFRARCLVRAAEAQPEQAAPLRAQALAEARRAVELQEHYAEPWLALKEAASAAGDERLARRAARKVARLSPRPTPP